MKDIVATLCAKISDIVTLVKILMMAIGNGLQEGKALEHKWKVKILEPWLYVRHKDV